ncbi:hypothetical protein DFJ74DRAFT_642649 [Hyaloraphidium curvatum]|nr:hypothetical protein DFJ74DRAFT_642649 [Hyaloraphidium curvatum]
MAASVRLLPRPPDGAPPGRIPVARVRLPEALAELLDAADAPAMSLRFGADPDDNVLRVGDRSYAFKRQREEDSVPVLYGLAGGKPSVPPEMHLLGQLVHRIKVAKEPLPIEDGKLAVASDRGRRSVSPAAKAGSRRKEGSAPPSDAEGRKRRSATPAEVGGRKERGATPAGKGGKPDGNAAAPAKRAASDAGGRTPDGSLKRESSATPPDSDRAKRPRLEAQSGTDSGGPDTPPSEQPKDSAPRLPKFKRAASTKGPESVASPAASDGAQRGDRSPGYPSKATDSYRGRDRERDRDRDRDRRDRDRDRASSRERDRDRDRRTRARSRTRSRSRSRSRDRRDRSRRSPSRASPPASAPAQPPVTTEEEYKEASALYERRHRELADLRARIDGFRSKFDRRRKERLAAEPEGRMSLDVELRLRNEFRDDLDQLDRLQERYVRWHEELVALRARFE